MSECKNAIFNCDKNRYDCKVSDEACVTILPDAKTCADLYWEGPLADEVFSSLEDVVNHPGHYTQGDIECIDAMKSAICKLEGIEAYDTAAAIKYLWRWNDKNGIQDLKKAIFYINHLIKELGGE